MKTQRWFGNIAAYIVLGMVGLTMLIPFGWMFIASLRTKNEFFLEMSKLLPSGLHWSNYAGAWTTVPYARFFENSTIVAIAVTLGQLLTCSLAAYAFAKIRFRGREALFIAYLGTMMVPAQVTMIPLFIMMVKFHWIDSYLALIVPSITGAYGCFLLRQFFTTIPGELEDAAKIDGCSAWGIYARIIMPLSKPALAAFGVITFLGSWNSFLWPLIVINRPSMKTLPIGLQSLQGFFGDSNLPILMAGAVFAALPMLVIFLFAQRYFIEGITLTGLKE